MRPNKLSKKPQETELPSILIKPKPSPIYCQLKAEIKFDPLFLIISAKSQNCLLSSTAFHVA